MYKCIFRNYFDAVRSLSILVHLVPTSLLQDMLSLLCTKTTTPRNQDETMMNVSASIGLKAALSELQANQGDIVTSICMTPLLNGLKMQVLYR